ncbi:MAG: DUF2228 domain-containing protein [Myxococcales bacterium]|nr:DUF2228 domain-containing protein [Myxococcales bacterium]MCB9705080.1 DUF2228 domain-containing protein [Myxococcales bacterium]
MRASPVDDALNLAAERWRSLFPIEGEGATLASWDPPFYLRGEGLVASMSLYDQETYRGPQAELVVVPEERLGDAAAALDELAWTVDALRRAGLAPALARPLAESLGYPEIRYREGLFAADAATVARREAALGAMRARFPAVAARMQEVYGLRLPRSLAIFAAFWRSLDPLEARGAERLGRSPGGIMIWFEDGGLDRRTRDGLDPRLECRFRCDPPELVTVMWGDSDGLHYGLWYDDPADPPTYVAHNYARDSAETWPDREPTPLGVLAAQARARIDEPDDEAPPLSVYAVREALEWFADADAEALAADPPAQRWLDAPRIPTLGTFGPALPEGAGTIRVGDSYARIKAWREQPARVEKWIASARRECAEGKPAAALTFGLDLHWLDADGRREEALELLVMAYEALGRHAHAETAKVHHAHRDLASVGVFLRADEAEG